jgi:hypothetical protein
VIQIDGNYINTPFRLQLGKDLITNVDGKKEPLWFTGKKHNPKRIILHHTAGEGGTAQLYRVLRGRGLSVHFGIDGDGKITQYADTHVKCSHAGVLNRDSIGIEISNRAVPPNVLEHRRSEYLDDVHGKKRHLLRFYLSQVIATHALCKLLCEFLGIPKEIPRVGNKALRGFYGIEQSKKHLGILGHLHCNERKIDPVPHIMDDLIGFFDAEAAATESAE